MLPEYIRSRVLRNVCLFVQQEALVPLLPVLLLLFAREGEGLTRRPAVVQST